MEIFPPKKNLGVSGHGCVNKTATTLSLADAFQRSWIRISPSLLALVVLTKNRVSVRINASISLNRKQIHSFYGYWQLGLRFGFIPPQISTRIKDKQRQITSFAWNKAGIGFTFTTGDEYGGARIWTPTRVSWEIVLFACGGR